MRRKKLRRDKATNQIEKRVKLDSEKNVRRETQLYRKKNEKKICQKGFRA